MATQPRSGADRIKRIGLKARPLGDLYHFLLTTRWSILIGAILAAYLVVNALFALVYSLDEGGVENMHGYGDAFFFSVQTMSTIGYGKMTPVGTFANVMVTVEAAFGLVSMAMATGLMFAKFSRPTARVRFSKYAVVSVRDRVPTFMVRLANERRTGLVEASLRIVVVRDERTAEGEHFRRFHPLHLARNQTVLFALSWTAVHAIDENSPLYGETTESLHASSTEIVASVVGIDEATRETVHARYAWSAADVLFGKKFRDILIIGADSRALDYTKFDDVEDAQK